MRTKLLNVVRTECRPAHLVARESCQDTVPVLYCTSSLQLAQRALCLLLLEILLLVLRGPVVHSGTSDLIAQEEQVLLLYGRNI
jgi:hypothetical protein